MFTRGKSGGKLEQWGIVDRGEDRRGQGALPATFNPV